MQGLVYDYHCHTTASDGALSPTELVHLAATHGVQSLAITDHDTVAGIEEAKSAAQAKGVELINGIELSVLWERTELHMVGLGMDIAAPEFARLVMSQQDARRQRAIKMGQKLERVTGLKNIYEAVCDIAGSTAPCRPHFAQWLVQNKQVRDTEHAFNRFLKVGRSAYVSTPWATLEDATKIVNESGGVAILAHPTRYRFTRMKLRRLLSEFCTYGGKGLEVALPRLTPAQSELLYDCLSEFPLVASGGSDFHSPQQQWLTLGKIPALKTGVPFVRSLLNLSDTQ